MYSSTATNLVSNDTNLRQDAFLYDVQTGETVRVSVSSSGQQGNSTTRTDDFGTSLASDGRTLVFQDHSTNLVPADNNLSLDIFVVIRP